LPEGLIEFQLIYYTNLSGDSTGIRTGSYVYGPYLRKIPENPFNHKNTFKKIGVSENFPSSASGTTGWYYKPSTGEIRLNWDGTDSSGVPFLEY